MNVSSASPAAPDRGQVGGVRHSSGWSHRRRRHGSGRPSVHERARVCGPSRKGVTTRAAVSGRPRRLRPSCSARPQLQVVAGWHVEEVGRAARARPMSRRLYRRVGSRGAAGTRRSGGRHATATATNGAWEGRDGWRGNSSRHDRAADTSPCVPSWPRGRAAAGRRGYLRVNARRTVSGRVAAVITRAAPLALPAADSGPNGDPSGRHTFPAAGRRTLTR